jgi:hypothetical protein
MVEVRTLTLGFSRMHFADSFLKLQASNQTTVQWPLWRVKHLEVVER